MTPTEMAALHKLCFVTPRPYKASEIESTLGSIGVFSIERPEGFLIARVIVDEVELLTLAVHPDHRRKGIAADIMGEFIGTSHRLGARMAFLDVVAKNTGAQALYERFDFIETDRRKGYYRAPDGKRSDAIMMMRDL
jgi:ribosomal-protein-alanine N-acetyltransferase